MFRNSILATALIATAATMAAATPGHARGNCKDVYIEAQNNTGALIQVADVHYMISGYGKKSEPVKNQEVPRGGVFSMTRNLERANERQTQIIIKYRVSTGNKVFNKWSPLRTATSSFKECKKNKAFRVSLTKK